MGNVWVSLSRRIPGELWESYLLGGEMGFAEFGVCGEVDKMGKWDVDGACSAWRIVGSLEGLAVGEGVEFTGARLMRLLCRVGWLRCWFIGVLEKKVWVA